MPNWLPPTLGTEPAVTIYFVLTYDGRVLACGVPKKAWNRIISFFGGFALVLTRFHASYSSVEVGARTHSLPGIGLLSPTTRGCALDTFGAVNSCWGDGAGCAHPPRFRFLDG